MAWMPLAARPRSQWRTMLDIVLMLLCCLCKERKQRSMGWRALQTLACGKNDFTTDSNDSFTYKETRTWLTS
eukprot:437422-Amphidinium_carterae.1